MKFIEIGDSLVNVNEIEYVSMSSYKTSITIYFKNGNGLLVNSNDEHDIIREYKRLKEALCDEQD